MDVIQRAIEKKYQISDRDELNQQTWEQFQIACRGKKIFMFGIGEAASYFVLNYHKDIQLDGIVDNDKSKQGFCVGEFMAEVIDTHYDNLIVSDISVLNDYGTEDVVILITSTRYYSPIIEQLEQMGITNYYLLLMMEANKRKESEEVCMQDKEAMKKAYLEECCKQRIERKKIVVSIGYYGGHGKYITEQLLKRDMNLDIIWIVKDLSLRHPKGVRLIYEKNWKKYIYEMETAQIWIYDIALPMYIRKRLGQIYIQTKHWSSITLKKFFLDDMSTTDTKDEIETIRYNGKIMDFIFTGSKFDEETCRSGFAFQGEFVRIGSARTDALFRQDNRKKVYEKYNLPGNIRCVLYAPTFRFIKTEKRKFFNTELDFEGLKKVLEKRFGGEWIILLRMHPSIRQESPKMDKDTFVVDVSEYDDCQELVAASDITISDYSSIMFEHAFINKPVFLFAPDRKQYVDKERDLLIKYDELPFPIAETNEDLQKNVINFVQEKYVENLEKFMNQFDIHEDGHASERAAKFIIGLIEKKERESDCGEGNSIDSYIK